jgi:hypothetical protein
MATQWVSIPRVERPTWRTGFARHAGESDAPEQFGGLVGCWAPFLGHQGGVLYDISGYNNLASLVNLTLATAWTVDQRGTALQLDGSGYISVPDSPSLSLVSGSVLAWVYVTSINVGSSAGIFGKGNLGTFTPIIAVEMDGAAGHPLNFYLGNNTSYGAINGTTATPTLTWFHAGITWDGTTYKLYLNAKEEASGSQTRIPNTTGHAAEIGKGGSNVLNGRVNDVRVYNRALATGELLAIYADPYAMYRLRPQMWAAGAEVAAGRTTKNIRSHPLGVDLGMRLGMAG